MNLYIEYTFPLFLFSVQRLEERWWQRKIFGVRRNCPIKTRLHQEVFKRTGNKTGNINGVTVRLVYINGVGAELNRRQLILVKYTFKIVNSYDYL